MNTLSVVINNKTYRVQKDFETVTRVETRMGIGCIGLGMKATKLELGMYEWAQLIHAIIDNGEKDIPTFQDIGKDLMETGVDKHILNIGKFLVSVYVGHKDESQLGGTEGNVPSAT